MKTVIYWGEAKDYRFPAQESKALPAARAMIYPRRNGRVAEWFKAAVLKTAVGASSPVGSNPTPSAKLLVSRRPRMIFYI